MNYQNSKEQFNTHAAAMIAVAAGKKAWEMSADAYAIIAADVAKQMNSIEKIDSSFKMEFNHAVMSPADIKLHVNLRSETGFEYVDSYINELKSVLKSSLKKPTL